VTTQSIEAFIQGLKQATIVGLDTETTGLNVVGGKDYLQGFSLAYDTPFGGLSEYFPFRHQTDNLPLSVLEELVEILRTKDIAWFNHKFDSHSLMTIGADPSKWEGQHYDGILMAHMLNEEWPYKKNLENCALYYLKKQKLGKDAMDAFTKQFGWGSVPPSLMHDYACVDAELHLELVLKLLGLCRKHFGEDFDKLWPDEIEWSRVLFRMEQRGVGVDLKFCRQYEAIAEMTMQELEDDLGFKPSKTTELSKFLLHDLGLPILEYTPGSYEDPKTKKVLKSPEKRRASFTKNVMEEYDAILENVDDERARQVLDYRGWQKANSSFYRPFQHLADANDRVHTNYKQHRTVTSRLSSEEPNLQQIPRSSDKAWNGRIKSAFRALPGWALIGFDYSQLELRLATAYGQEDILLDEFAKDDADPFTRYSSIINADRFTTKTFFYAMIYGAGEEKIATTLHRTVPQIHNSYVAFRDNIPRILRAADVAKAKARQRGYIRYWSGRRRHFRNPSASYKAFNSLLQGGGAEVVKHVAIEIDKEVTHPDECHMLLQVHDELVFEIREDLLDVYSPQIVNTMEKFPTDFFGLPFHVVGKQWGAA
jgi:DNA polymerase-1